MALAFGTFLKLLKFSGTGVGVEGVGQRVAGLYQVCIEQQIVFEIDISHQLSRSVACATRFELQLYPLRDGQAIQEFVTGCQRFSRHYAVQSNQLYLRDMGIAITDCQFQYTRVQCPQHLAFAAVIALMIVVRVAEYAGSV